jgi:Gp5 N-terminal OB domain/Uncharacterized protein conserved in bacteria (DUF2345)
MTNDIWFLGIVEDIKDPKKLGRVKVRLINEYSNRVETDDIPWAIPLTPVTNPSILGLGTAPVGLQKGSRVIVIFLDGEAKTKPMVIGSYPIIMGGNESDHSVSDIARGNKGVQKDYLDYEPKSKYAAEYPNNNTLTTKSGHVIEIDDTPKAERIHVYHKSGSYVEFFPDGSVISKSMKTYSDITVNDKLIISDKGDISLAANDGSIFLQSDKDIIIATDTNNIGVIAEKDIDISSKGDVVIESQGQVKITSEGDITIKGAKIDLQGVVTVNGKPILTA